MRLAVIAAFLLAAPLLPLTEKTAACDAECDKQAAACVDACEEQFKNDPAQRVGCKVKCAEKRASCSKDCGVVVE